MSDPNDAERLRVLERLKDDFVFCCEDGFYYFLPRANCGFYYPHVLRWIADELDRLNKPWEELIEKEIGKAGE